MPDLGVSLCFFKNNYNDDHPHYQWHSNAFLYNVILTDRKFRISCTFDPLATSRFLLPQSKAIRAQKKIFAYLSDSKKPLNKSQLLHSIRTRLSNRQSSLFKFEIPIGHAIHRITNRIQLAHNKVKPATFIVFIKLLLNAWPTARRMSTFVGNTNSKTCVFCQRAEDSIEHFVYCPFVRRLFSRMRVPLCDHSPVISFFALTDSCLHPPHLFLHLRALALLFHIHATLRHHPPTSPPLHPDELLNAAIQLR